MRILSAENVRFSPTEDLVRFRGRRSSGREIELELRLSVLDALLAALADEEDVSSKQLSGLDSVLMVHNINLDVSAEAVKLEVAFASGQRIAMLIPSERRELLAALGETLIRAAGPGTRLPERAS